MPTNVELSRIMLDAYNAPRDQNGFGEFKPYGEPWDLANGLRIQAYINRGTHEVMIGVAGSNGVDDASTFPSFMNGDYHDQFRQAVNYAYEIREIPELQGYQFTATGHSLGGGISQVLAHTFGWGGASFDAV